DEIIRWVTPVRHFLRHAREDYVLGGNRIRAGDRLLLSYLSANRDESVFADPSRFDIRRPNASDHLAFGIGVHFCLGAHLARMELRAFLPARAAALARVDRARRRARVHVVDVRRGSEAGADPLPDPASRADARGPHAGNP